MPFEAAQEEAEGGSAPSSPASDGNKPGKRWDAKRPASLALHISQQEEKELEAGRGQQQGQSQQPGSPSRIVVRNTFIDICPGDEEAVSDCETPFRRNTSAPASPSGRPVVWGWGADDEQEGVTTPPGGVEGSQLLPHVGLLASTALGASLPSDEAAFAAQGAAGPEALLGYRDRFMQPADCSSPWLKSPGSPKKIETKPTRRKGPKQGSSSQEAQSMRLGDFLQMGLPSPVPPPRHPPDATQRPHQQSSEQLQCGAGGYGGFSGAEHPSSPLAVSPPTQSWIAPPAAAAGFASGPGSLCARGDGYRSAHEAHERHLGLGATGLFGVPAVPPGGCRSQFLDAESSGLQLAEGFAAGTATTRSLLDGSPAHSAGILHPTTYVGGQDAGSRVPPPQAVWGAGGSLDAQYARGGGSVDWRHQHGAAALHPCVPPTACPGYDHHGRGLDASARNFAAGPPPHHLSSLHQPQLSKQDMEQELPLLSQHGHARPSTFERLQYQQSLQADAHFSGTVWSQPNAVPEAVLHKGAGRGRASPVAAGCASGGRKGPEQAQKGGGKAAGGNRRKKGEDVDAVEKAEAGGRRKGGDDSKSGGWKAPVGLWLAAGVMTPGDDMDPTSESGQAASKDRKIPLSGGGPKRTDYIKKFSSGPEDAASPEAAASAASAGAITTMMLKNIPCRKNQDEVMSTIDFEGFQGRYDFFYLPRDVKFRANLGYAFVNFLTPEDASQFQTRMDGYRFVSSGSSKACQVVAAHVQGVMNNLLAFKRTEVMRSNRKPYFSSVMAL